jgi:hypothetical protein
MNMTVHSEELYKLLYGPDNYSETYWVQKVINGRSYSSGGYTRSRDKDRTAGELWQGGGD